MVHPASPTTSTHHHHGGAALLPSLPLSASLSCKCLVPVEFPLSHDGELSARDTLHRTVDHFEAVVHDTTWLLHQALTPHNTGSGGGGLLGRTADASSHSEASDSGGGTGSSGSTSGDGGFFPSAKTRRQVMAQSQRAFAFFRLHQYGKAVKDYDACLTSEPTSALWYYNRGCAWYASQKRERAIQDFTRALKIDCKNMLYVESRAMVSKELGRFQEAIQDYTWLETLRRMAHHTSASHRRESQTLFLNNNNAPSQLNYHTVPSGEERTVESTSRLDSVRGSFSMSFSELQVSLMGAVISGGKNTTTHQTRDSSTPSSSSSSGLVTDGLTTEEREQEVMNWMIRFLQQPPRNRKPREIQAALRFVKAWHFFRGMDAEMVRQCLEDAVYSSFKPETVVLEQDSRATHFHVVLNPRAPFVKNIDAHGGISKLRELKKLSQGDAIGTDAHAVSFNDGVLRTIKFEIAQVSTNGNIQVPARQRPARTRQDGRDTAQRHGHRGSLEMLLSSPSLVSMLTDTTPLVSTNHPTSPSSHSHTTASSAVATGTFLPPEPASFTSLEQPVHCLLLEVDSYREILHDHEVDVLEERVAFLRGCRVFQSCTDDVLTALAAVSGARVYDPGKDLLCLGDEVTQLCVIKRGVCQVRKTIRVPVATTASAHKGEPASRTTRPSSGDGSWVLDNGWMLTNPRLVNTANALGKEAPMVNQEVNVGILASGQVFGELSVLQPRQSSQVTIHSQTLVEILVFQQNDLARLNIQYRSGTMNALQASLLFHNPPQQKILQLQHDLERWEKQKRSVLGELSLQLPSKARSVIRGASCMAKKSPTAKDHMRRRTSLTPVLVPPKTASPMRKNERLHKTASLPRLAQR